MSGMRQGVVRDLTPAERHRFGIGCQCGQPCGRVIAPWADRMRAVPPVGTIRRPS